MNYDIGNTPKTPYVTGDNGALVGALHNDIDARQLIKRETPVHRRMLELHIQGFTHTEIAGLVGVSKQTVKNILRQSWARQYMIEHTRRSLSDEIEQLLKSEVINSIQTVIDIRDSDYSRPETKLAASNSLIDRVTGKATQPILSVKPADPTTLPDAELDAIIARERGSRETTPSSN